MQFWTKCCQLFELPPSLPPDSIFHLQLLTNSGQKRFNAKDETMTILTAFLCRSRPGWNEVQDSLQVRGGEVDHILRLRPNHQGDNKTKNDQFFHFFLIAGHPSQLWSFLDRDLQQTWHHRYERQLHVAIKQSRHEEKVSFQLPYCDHLCHHHTLIWPEPWWVTLTIIGSGRNS